ncbi:MAG: TIGR04222 domain-containing membrane protein [Bryobacteraceae bacterium]
MLLHNPVADMRGPEFLILYLTIIAATLLIYWFRLQSVDQTESLGPALIPTNPDPYQIAYLRAGVDEVVRLVVAGLADRGYLDVNRALSQIRQSASPPDLHPLNHFERRVFDWFATPKYSRDMASTQLRMEAGTHCRQYEGILQNEQLLTSAETRAAAWRLAWTAISVIAILGGYKLIVALSRGRRNVLFLILMGIAGSAIALVMARRPRLSARGRAWLRRLELAYESLRPGYADAAATMQGSAPLLLAAGLFGTGILAGGAYEHFLGRRRPYGDFGGSSCSSGGDSSCSGGGDGGGGGSGCGGCGGGGE